mmetsp:Transcript_21860/g.75160  ORF Transcript_21860/g.75160 Transcript_21860/m.75160 type:complete len:479 (-) Transcript_21860:1825-3261(-)
MTAEMRSSANHSSAEAPTSTNRRTIAPGTTTQRRPRALWPSVPEVAFKTCKRAATRPANNTGGSSGSWSNKSWSWASTTIPICLAMYNAAMHASPVSIRTASPEPWQCATVGAEAERGGFAKLARSTYRQAPTRKPSAPNRATDQPKARSWSSRASSSSRADFPASCAIMSAPPCLTTHISSGTSPCFAASPRKSWMQMRASRQPVAGSKPPRESTKMRSTSMPEALSCKTNGQTCTCSTSIVAPGPLAADGGGSADGGSDPGCKGFVLMTSPSASSKCSASAISSGLVPGRRPKNLAPVPSEPCDGRGWQSLHAIKMAASHSKFSRPAAPRPMDDAGAEQAIAHDTSHPESTRRRRATCIPTSVSVPVLSLYKMRRCSKPLKARQFCTRTSGRAASMRKTNKKKSTTHRMEGITVFNCTAAEKKCVKSNRSECEIVSSPVCCAMVVLAARVVEEEKNPTPEPAKVPVGEDIELQPKA